jgi:NTE family protein
MTLSSKASLVAALSVTALLLAPIAGAEAASDEARSRPRIGLVLGGGGAKGAAHIGVLRVLDELRIPIDCVAGTSMGALVGATFAAGVPPAELESQVLAVDWAETVGGRGDRALMPIQRKLQSRPFTNSIEVGVKNGKLEEAGGFLNTQNIDALLRRLVGSARYVDDFDALPIPFRAIATDMVAGEMVVLDNGDLSVAMRASMAVPGAFSPVIMDDMVLADGGQMRNLPVDIGRAMCGDVIIAVSLATPQPTAADLSSSLAVAARALDVMIDANSKAQLATLTDQDVSIVVQMGDIGSGSFERVPDAIPLGQAAALARSEELARYSLSPEEYRRWRSGVDRDYRQPIEVAGVEVVGLERVNPQYVEQIISATQPGAEVSPEVISQDSNRIFGLGDFEGVSYRITNTPAFPTVEFHPIEKSWGPNLMNFDLGFSAANEGDTALVLRVEHRRVWLNSRGAEWRNAAQIGTDMEFQTGLYQPIDTRQRYFIEPHVRITRYYEDVYDDGNREAEYSFTESYGQLDLGVNLGSRAQLRLGLRQSWNEVNLETGTADFLPETPDTQESDIVVQAKYDTRDTVGLASSGNLLVGRYLESNTWLGGEESYSMAEALALIVLPFRGDTVNVFTAGGIDVDGDIPGYRRYRIGGIRSFPGMQLHQLRGDAYWLAGGNYNWRIKDIQELFDQALYAGVRLTTGEVDGRTDSADDGIISGLALTLSGRTPVGPFALSLGGTDNGFWALQLAFGRPIREGSIFDEIW